MVDFVQNMHVFETVIFDIFYFGISFCTQQVVDSSKSIHYKMGNYMGYLILLKFFENLLQQKSFLCTICILLLTSKLDRSSFIRQVKERCPPFLVFFIIDFRVLIHEESKYGIIFYQQITYFSSYGRFYAKIEGS